MRPKRVVTAAVGAALLVGSTAGCEPPPSLWQSELISVNGAGDGSANDDSSYAVFSPDGTKVFFTSYADDLGPTDSDGGAEDVYLRDLATGTTTLVSTDAGGGSTSPAGVDFFHLSPDGTKLSFTSEGGDFGPTDTNGAADLYVRDLATDTTTLVSANAAGTDAGNAGSGGGLFSADGSKVLFTSSAGDLGPTDTNGVVDTYVRDLATGTTTLVSVNAAGTDAANDRSESGTFSPDGTKVSFTTIADDLGPTDSNEIWDVYVRDLTTGVTTLVSASANAGGTAAATANASSSEPVFSPDGTKVAFTSSADDLGPVDTNDAADIYLRDLVTGATSLVSVDAAGTDAADEASSSPVFSPDGTKLTFESDASDLGPTDTNEWTDIYLRDLVAGTTSLVSINADGSDAGNGLTLGTPGPFSPDGTKYLFATFSDDLGPRDTNRASNPFGGVDVYVRDLVTGTANLVSAIPEGIDSGNANSNGASFSPDGSQVVFTSTASNLNPADGNSRQDVFLATLHGTDLSVALSAEPSAVPSGGQLTYRVDATNRGPEGADEAVAAMLLPSETTLVDATSSAGACDPPPPEHPQLVVCPIGTVAAGDSASVEVTVTVTAPPDTTLTVLAAFDSPASDPDGRNDITALDTPVTHPH